jgi:hypothetical protein
MAGIPTGACDCAVRSGEDTGHINLDLGDEKIFGVKL